MTELEKIVRENAYMNDLDKLREEYQNLKGPAWWQWLGLQSLKYKSYRLTKKYTNG
jgi:hypothetical protein